MCSGRTTLAVSASEASGAGPLEKRDLSPGVPLAHSLVDANGAPLYAAGESIESVRALDFLFEHFEPRLAGEDVEAASVTVGADTERGRGQPLEWDAMHIGVGARIGMRPAVTLAQAMRSSRLIGFAPNGALFATPPRGADVRTFAAGDPLDMVALSELGVFRFFCTVQVVCTEPFEYLVLSAPTEIRRVRRRQALRVSKRVPVRYAGNLPEKARRGLGALLNISSHGALLCAPEAIAQEGERVQLNFRVRTDDILSEVEVNAIVRNVDESAGPEGRVLHGLEFEALDSPQRIALKLLIASERRDARHKG